MHGRSTAAPAQCDVGRFAIWSFFGVVLFFDNELRIFEVGKASLDLVIGERVGRGMAVHP